MSPSASGRPRVSGASLTGQGTRADILAASAELFCSRGFGGTSTHAIASTAGIRQASLYHHFRNKQEILLELLLGTVKPSLRAAEELIGFAAESPQARLWALCVSDVRLLSSGEHNVASLYLIPELEDPFFEPFHALRAELESHYFGLIRDADLGVEPPEQGAVLVLALVENVILLRRRRPREDFSGRAEGIAAAALRMLGFSSSQREEARLTGSRILAALD